MFRCEAVGIVLFVSFGGEIAAAAETAENNERGFYVGASVSRVEHQTYNVADPLIAVRLDWGATALLRLDQVGVDETDAGWNLTLGYRINKYLTAELSYYDFGEASITQDYSSAIQVPGPLYFTTRISVEGFGPGVSLLGTLPLTSSLDLFARGGVLFLHQEIERYSNARSPTLPSAFRGLPFRSSERTGDQIWIAGAGVQWSFASRWATRLEYQLTDHIEAERDPLAGQVGTTKLEQVSLSVLFDF